MQEGSFRENIKMSQQDYNVTIRKITRFLSVASLALLVSACASQVANVPKAGLNGNGGYGSYGGANGVAGPVTPGTTRDFSVNVGNQVLFPTSQTTLTDQARQTLQKQARWLNQYPNFTITIEGHADERGTREYNLGLGAKRAQSIKGYLVQSGVRSARLRTISYGKERPVSICDNISCWSKNRRGVTLLNRRS